MKRILLSFLFLFLALAPAAAQTSAQDALAIPCPAPTAAAPIWARLVVSGNTVSCYYAKGTATPTSWTQISTAKTIGFVNNPILVGMYMTSHDATKIGTGTIDNFSVTPAASYRLTDVDIGAPQLMGSANLINGVWNLAGSGADIWGTSDQFNFQPWLVWGDCVVTCRITSISGSNIWQKMGIMVRDGFNSGSDFAEFCATSAEGISFQYRATFSNNPDKTLLVAPPAPGIVSSVITGYGLTGSTTYTIRP